VRLTASHGHAVLVGLVWMASVAGSLALRQAAGAVPLLWLPSSITVAALYLMPREGRLALLASIAVGSAIINFHVGLDAVTSLFYVLAALAEPVITVGIARRVLHGRRLESVDLKDMVLLFLGALAGSGASGLIAFPLEHGVASLGWWIYARTLGTVVGAPIIISLHDRLKRRKGGWRQVVARLPKTFLLVQAGIFALSLWVVATPYFSLTQLVLAALVLVVVRYGQLAASCGVLAFAIAGTIESIGGASPAAYLDYPPIEGGVILQSFMGLMLATSLPLAALLMRHDRLAQRLAARNARMRENLLMLRMAEEVGRIGRWRYDPRTGVQDWSRQMYLINGLDPAMGRDPGDLKALLPDGGKELFGQLAHHAHDRARYSFEYRIQPPHGEERILKMHVSNQFDEDGELVGIFSVVMDVTQHHQRQEALDKERTRAMRLAAEAQYLAHTDPLTGLANRRRAITQLEKCVRRAETGGGPLALVSFDIDHFKRINDTNGHQTGDDVLVRVADIARNQTRASDLIGRIGGEEFIWILPDAGADEVRHAAERLRQAIEQESSENGLPMVTASIGYALWCEGDDANRLLARVDKALYEAKQAGRNTVQKAA